MKRTLLALATVITTTAAGTSFYFATLPNLTDTQKQLSDTANTIMIAGSKAIFKFLENQDKDKNGDQSTK